MFLSRLSDVQKESVVDLLVIAANVDGELADEEKDIIERYCAEMSVDVRYEVSVSLEEAIRKLADNSSRAELKKILVELGAMILCDSKYVEEEKQLIETYTEITRITPEETNHAFDLLNRLSEIYAELGEYVSE